MATQLVQAQSETPDILAIRKELEEGSLGSNFYVRLLGLKTFDTFRLLHLIDKGLSVAAFSRFQRNIGLSQEELAQIVGIADRTLSRRKSEGRLEPNESDRLLRTSRVFGDALRLFEGDASAARAWMIAPLRALGDINPLSACRSEFGAHEVEKLIGRLEHGVFA